MTEDELNEKLDASLDKIAELETELSTAKDTIESMEQAFGVIWEESRKWA